MSASMIDVAIDDIKRLRDYAKHEEEQILKPLRKFGIIGISLFDYDVHFNHYKEVEEFTNMKVKTQRYFDANYSHEAYVEMGGIKYFALMTPSEYVEWKGEQDESS